MWIGSKVVATNRVIFAVEVETPTVDLLRIRAPFSEDARRSYTSMMDECRA